jgi:hypothetical protein
MGKEISLSLCLIAVIFCLGSLICRELLCLLEFFWFNGSSEMCCEPVDASIFKSKSTSLPSAGDENSEQENFAKLQSFCYFSSWLCPSLYLSIQIKAGFLPTPSIEMAGFLERCVILLSMHTWWCQL